MAAKYTYFVSFWYWREDKASGIASMEITRTASIADMSAVREIEEWALKEEFLVDGDPVSKIVIIGCQRFPF